MLPPNAACRQLGNRLRPLEWPTHIDSEQPSLPQTSRFSANPDSVLRSNRKTSCYQTGMVSREKSALTIKSTNNQPRIESVDPILAIQLAARIGAGSNSAQFELSEVPHQNDRSGLANLCQNLLVELLEAICRIPASKCRQRNNKTSDTHASVAFDIAQVLTIRKPHRGHLDL